MSREALMKFREEVLADEGLQQELRELMEGGDWRSGDAAFADKANAWVEQKGYTDVGFTTEEIVDFLENPGADVELSDLELEIVAGGIGTVAWSPLSPSATANESVENQPSHAIADSASRDPVSDSGGNSQCCTGWAYH